MVEFYPSTSEMNILNFILIATTWTAVSATKESLFSLACSHADKVCSLYKIDINQSSDHAVSNEVAKWNQTNVGNGFGSVAGFRNANMQYIVMTTDCDNHSYLINTTNLAAAPSSIMMKTLCTQPVHSLTDRSLLALGTVPNGMGGSSPVSLYEFDAISGHSNRGIRENYFPEHSKI